MKKVCVLFLSIFILPAFATGIGSTTSAPCDNATLSKYNGTADIEINWEPNTINLTWYDGDTQLNVPVASQTCTYDGMITVPPAPPEKLGYTFNGWKIPKIDFSTIPTDVNGTNRWAIGWNNNATYCFYDTNTGSAWNVNCNSDSTYNELQTHEWKVRFEHGDLYGMAGCSTTNGTWANTGTPTIGTGQYCWCKATGYKATNASVISGPASTLSWVFYADRGSAASCAQNCATNCAASAERNSAFRTALFAPASN